MNSLPKSLPEMTVEGGATDEIRHRLLAVWSIGTDATGMEHSPRCWVGAHAVGCSAAGGMGCLAEDE